MAKNVDGLMLEMEHTSAFIYELKRRYGEIETTVWWDIENLENPPPMPMEVGNQELTDLIRIGADRDHRHWAGIWLMRAEKLFDCEIFLSGAA